MAAKAKDSSREMSFLDHLEALRWHLVRSAIVIVIMLVVAFANKSFLFDTVVFWPVAQGFY